MKKFNLILFIAGFSIMMGALIKLPMYDYEMRSSFKNKTARMSLAQRADFYAKDRAERLANSVTGKVEPMDWYRAMGQIDAMKMNKLSARSGDIEWTQRGPDNVAGRTRSFIFDNQKDGRCYTAGVNGGMYVSEDLGHVWKPVVDMADSFKIMSIGCMDQSIEGDIYAGTGEYWANNGSQDIGIGGIGNGIYKKSADGETWTLLPSTHGNLFGTGNYDVIDIACDPADNNTVYAATSSGLLKSINGGTTWTNSGTGMSGPVTAIEVAMNGELYAGNAGKVFKSTNAAASWQLKNGGYTSDGNGHMVISVSKTNPKVVVACGITGGSDLKYVVRSTDGGDNWKLIGTPDASFNPLCGEAGGMGNCQGWYDLCMAIHPMHEDILYLGGSVRSYSWSAKYGWVKLSEWNENTGGLLGINQIHADMHHITFHPTHADTMVICTDGGPYMTRNALSGAPDPTWVPVWTKYNVTQFYDIAVSKYGEILGGAQDNGCQLLSSRGGTQNTAFEIKGGDGFDVAVSAHDDYQVVFGTVYNGGLERITELLQSKRKNIVTGCAGNSGSLSSVGFFTKIHLAESLIKTEDGKKDSVEFSYLLAYNDNGQLTMSNNAYHPDSPTVWTPFVGMGIGTLHCAHSSKDLGVLYVGGSGGLKRITTLRTRQFNKDPNVAASLQPCYTPLQSSEFTPCTGISGVVNVYVDQTDPNFVVACNNGFGGSKVFLSTNGTSFVPKQGNLPSFPVYAIVTDPTDSKHVVIGTEFGIWETDDITASSPQWVEANNVIGRVPVYQLRVRAFWDDDCTMIYAGTHGRGNFSAPFPKKSNCDYTLKSRPSTSKIVDPLANSKVHFDVFPNPASDEIKITFSAESKVKYTMNIYDMNGRQVKKMNCDVINGQNVLSTDISMLKDGNYIVRLENEKSVVAGQVITKK